MQKNEIVELTIEDMTTEGLGVAHAEGYTVFVKDAVTGDRVLAGITRPKKKYAFARLVEILAPSPDRVTPPCPQARRCGSCQIAALTYEAQLAFKKRLVLNNLSRLGGLAEVPFEEIVGMDPPFRYRNKSQYPVGEKDGHLVCGYYAARTHDIIDIRDCALAPRHNALIIDRVLSFSEKNGIGAYDEKTGEGLLRHILIREGFVTGEIMVCLVINGRSLPHAEELVRTLLEADPGAEREGQASPEITSICLNVNESRTNVILGNEVIPLFGETWISDRLGPWSFRISPLSFYQINPVQTVRLYETAVEFAGLTGREVVFDLFCGIGTISHFLAPHAREVYGVEIVPQAIQDAKDNARRNGITNCRFFAAAAEEVAERGRFDEETPLPHPDVIVLDPPRKGCEPSLLSTIRALKPDRIVYVSCDSATLARDIKLLTAPGEEGECSYRVERVKAFDMFSQTVHVETVCLLTHSG